METNLGADTLYNLETATGEGGSSKESGESDFEERPSKSKDNKLGQKKKEKEDKESSKKKDKDKGYAALEGESSPEDSEMEVKSPFKGKKRSFKFASRKDKKPKDEEKEKEKKKEKKSKECDASSVEISKDDSSKLEKSEKKREKKEKESKSKEKEKDKEPKAKDSKGKEIKNKLKLKDKKKTKSNPSLETDLPVFGVPLELAVQRSRCHDGIELPVVVRSCIDYIEENGLQQEGIYRSSGLKTRVMELRRAYNNRENVVLSETEPPIVASLLKQYLRELPENILTNDLLPKFEDASSLKDPQNQEEIFLHLVQQLPSCNKLLLSWLMIHMAHVIEKERFNKMNVQNLSIVLCPTLNLTHRVMACFFAHTRSLFADTRIIKYIPPLSGFGVSLPIDTAGMAIELKKQESLLAQIHEEMSVGSVAKHREEQLWEAQRIVTQLKRKLKQTAPTTASTSTSDITSFKCSDSANSEKAPLHTREVEIEKNDEELKLELALPAESSPELSEAQQIDTTCESQHHETFHEENQPDTVPLPDKTNNRSETPPTAAAVAEIRKEVHEFHANAAQTKTDFTFNAEQDFELALMIENSEREKLIEQIAEAIEKERKTVERLQELLAEKSAWTDSSEEDESVEMTEEEQEQLLAEILRENRELEEKNLMLQKQIEETQEICLNYRVQLRVFEEKMKLTTVVACETIG